MSHHTPASRRLALLIAFAAATGVAWTEERPEQPAERPEGTKHGVKAAEPSDCPAPPPESVAPADPNNSAPVQPPAAAPSRDATKPARPANKQRPAWPPPPELIS